MFNKDDLLNMSRKELQSLKNDIDDVMGQVEKNERAAAWEEAQKAAAQYGYSLSDLVSAKPATKAGKSKLPPKYRNPENPTQTWSGRGRRPHWINEAADAGREIEEFAI